MTTDGAIRPKRAPNNSAKPGSTRGVTLHDALEYYARGFAIIPLRPGTKKAAVKWQQFQTERPIESNLRQWFGNDDQTGLAVILGPVSGGLVCREYDDVDSYGLWASEHSELARTLPTVATPRPGRHVYCYADVAQLQSVKGGSILVCDDGEVRGGGYCVLPPSKLDQKEYRWEIPFGPDIPRVDLFTSGLIPEIQHRERKRNTEGLKDMSYAVLDPPPPESMSSGNSPLELAIARTLPRNVGHRHRCLFEFARELKALPEYCNADLSDLRPILVRWHQLALPVIRTKSFDESWFDFIEGWGRVKFSKGQEPIQIMFDTAKQAAEECLPQIALQYDTAEVRLLICFCRELQRYHGDKPFFLGCRTAGRLLGIKYDRAFRWLKMLCVDKVLAHVSSGTLVKHRANEYRYLAG